MRSNQVLPPPARFLTAVFLTVVLICSPLQARPRPALEEVLRRVERVRADGGKPVVVLDLDDTIFRTSYRTKAVLKDWAAALPGVQHAVRTGVDSLDPGKMPYYLTDTLDMAGISDPVLRKSADTVWSREFFGDRYMNEDRAIRGAPEYVRVLLRAGAKVVYLTARDIPRMKRGTVRQLAHRDFPMPDGRADVVLMMKPDAKIKDVDYKESVTARINAMGRVVASFDNEPRNLLMFRQRFPGAILVYVDTPHSKDSPPLTPAMKTIADFGRD